MKPYRRCHGLPRLGNQPMNRKDPRCFDVKGKKAEAAVAKLAEASFFADWCFPNPKWPHNAEVCDLFVQFDDAVLLWTIKDVRKNGRGQYPEKRVKSNKRQLADAVDDLIHLRTPLTLRNGRRSDERFDATTVKRTILISLFMGEPPRGGNDMFWEERGHLIHNMSGSSLTILLWELDTIADFIAYLEAKEGMYRNGRALVRIEGAQEEGLLAFYLAHGRSFQPIIESDRPVVIGLGAWEKFTKSDRYLHRKWKNRESYYWDFLIDRAHTMGFREYEIVAREMARPNRHGRALLASKLFDSARNADEQWKQRKPGYSVAYHGLTRVGESVYIFPFADPTMDPEVRREVLRSYVLFARDRYATNGKALGVSTTFGPGRREHDFSFVHAPDWSDAEHQAVEEWRKTRGIEGRPMVDYGPEYEFEDSPESTNL